jgi:hypothetical protein
MRTYCIDDAKVIIGDFGEKWVEFKPDGVHLCGDTRQYDPTQVLSWKYVCELDDSDSPNPLTAPCLPFPFTANQLAAFMLDGVGAAIASNYGNWEIGPDQGMLDSMDVLAREPKRAIAEAYASYAAALVTAGDYPIELQRRADRIRKIYNYRNLKANARERVFVHGIDRDETNARRARAVASNAELEKLYDLATKAYQAASAAWRKAMVIELLQPAPAQTLAPEVAAAPVHVSNGPAPLTTGEIAGCFAGFHGWDSDKWISNMQSPAPWLKACQHQAGRQGKPIVESTWWPVQIAQALDKKHTNIRRKLHSRFKNQEPLKPWLESLETHLPDDSETFENRL